MRIGEAVKEQRRLVPPNPAALNLSNSLQLKIGYVRQEGRNLKEGKRGSKLTE